MSMDRYLSGNRVYRHGSHAPTIGTVDPQGYVERELRKRMFDTSQTRSGLAQAALQRLRGGTMQPPQRQPMPWNPGGGGPGIQRQPMPAPSGTFSPGGGGATAPGLTGSQAALQARIAAVKAEHAAEQQQQQAALKAKMASRPQVSPTGKIKKPTPVAPKPKPTALPWDMDAMQQKIDAGDQWGQLRNALLAARQGTEHQFSSGMHELDTQQPGEERGLLNDFGGRGLAFGSGYGMGVGNLQNKFAGLRAALQNARNDSLTDIQNQYTQGSSTYNKTLAAIQQALAQRLSKRAGSLGFGPVK